MKGIGGAEGAEDRRCVDVLLIRAGGGLFEEIKSTLRIMRIHPFVEVLSQRLSEEVVGGWRLGGWRRRGRGITIFVVIREERAT
jgi:hypothetical protein